MSDATAVTCPHCGRLSCGVRNGAAHAAMCPHNPDVAPRIRAALENPDRPGWAFGGVIYARRARECGAPSAEILRAAFGSWAAACAHFGLASGRDRETQAIREVEDALEAAARLREAWRDYGLPVCRVREIDGGRRVACELR